MSDARLESGVSAVVPAAGAGLRFGGDKIWEDLCGQPVLGWVLRALGDPSSGVSELVVVIDAKDHRRVVELSAALAPRLGCRCVGGGPRRQDSVANGLSACSRGMVVVHDGARPGVSTELLVRVIGAARRVGAATAYVPVVDSTARILDGELEQVLPRAELGAIQTPQAFELALIRRAHEHARVSGLEADDDAALVRAIGRPVAAVLGEPRNLKVTKGEDMDALRSWFAHLERARS
ncbi:MAG TPA: IspD/TarI family cytidylyltransferase [Candidatus Dormibacteraeota bacterium]|nr:IspD/TarI family cytidylyltransferase [Candidatus Dormibacteraeota bacterium]